MTSYKSEVIADGSGQWVANALRFATEKEAAAYGIDLAGRWRSVRKSRVVECVDPVNYRWDWKAQEAVSIAGAL